jgi:hypothetical protein
MSKGFSSYEIPIVIVRSEGYRKEPYIRITRQQLQNCFDSKNYWIDKGISEKYFQYQVAVHGPCQRWAQPVVHGKQVFKGCFMSRLE